jgi:hypothetical protein
LTALSLLRVIRRRVMYVRLHSCMSQKSTAPMCAGVYSRPDRRRTIRVFGRRALYGKARNALALSWPSPSTLASGSWPSAGAARQPLPPWKPIFPLILPQRWPMQPPPRSGGAPASWCASSLHLFDGSDSSRQTEALKELSRSSVSRLGTSDEGVVTVVMGLLSLRIRRPEPNHSRPPSLIQ